jgi:hypothetical protein
VRPHWIPDWINPHWQYVAPTRSALAWWYCRYLVYKLRVLVQRALGRRKKLHGRVDWWDEPRHPGRLEWVDHIED